MSLPAAPPDSPPFAPPSDDACATDAASLAIGIVIHVLGSIGINTGQNLQAMALSELDEEAMKKPWKSRSWLIGCIMFISCSILNFVALTLAPASILVPLESVQFVNNVVFGLVVRKIEIPLRMWCGVACMITGTFAVVVFGAPCQPHFDAEHLEGLWSWEVGYGWWTWCMVTFALSAGSLYTHRWYDGAIKRGEVSSSSLLLDARRSHHSHGLPTHAAPHAACPPPSRGAASLARRRLPR